MSSYASVAYLPMFPSGFHDISEDDLERIFVDPFIVGSHRRKELCEKFREWLKAVKNTGVPLEIWVDGSFVTYKPEPADIDIACIMNAEKVRSLEPTALGYFIGLFKTDVVKLKYGCHVFSVQEGNFCDYNYWIDFFGHSRDGAPKGIARIFLGGGS